MTDCERKDAEKAAEAGAVMPERVRVWEDEFHVLHVSLDGETHSNVRAVRAFPISGKADYVSFLDEKNHEVVLLAHPHRLDRDSRCALEQALEKMYYVAAITRVDSITETMGVSKWEVDTDRGYAVFEVVDRRQHIRRLPHGRYMITDADGNRFEIEDLEQLDRRSQAIVHSEV